MAKIDSQTAVEAPLHEFVEQADALHATLYQPTRARRRALSLLALVWLISAGLFMLPSLVHLHNDLDAPTIISHLAVAITGMVFSILLLLMIVQLRELPKRQTFLGSAAGAIGAAATVAAIDIALFDLIHAFFSQEHATHISYMVKWTGNFAIFMSQFSIIAVTFWMLESLEANRVHQFEIEQIRRVAAEAQYTANRARLSALRYQLNPHFLFNTLNSISSLVVTKRTRDAERMLTALSEFLRATLSRDPEDPQTLEMELETITSYLAIERIRFGERLAIEIDCPAALRNAGIPPFLIQPLVENAIKHAVAETEETVTIALSARRDSDDLVVVVENDQCCDRGSGETRSGIGLRNVEARLMALYGERGRVETVRRQKSYIAIARMPFVIEATG